MAHANFQEWLVAFLQKQCGFNPEDANEIKDEIVKNIEWYKQQEESKLNPQKMDAEALKKALDEIAKMAGNNYPQPYIMPSNYPFPYKDMWVGDPLPGQEPTTGDGPWKETKTWTAKK